jgi:hypothetical protein
MKSRLPFLTPIIAVLLGLAVLGSTVACVFPERGGGGERDHGHEHDHDHEHDHEHEHDQPMK